MSKQYGLITSSKSKVFGSLVKKPSIFQNDSDSSDEPDKPTGFQTTIKRQDRVMQQKAVAEDPTVYQYDEIYDEIDKKRTESKLARKDLDKKPKYISKLMQSAERRKRENERRIERQVQKEREAEGEMFKDKESFVTSAYKQKLEELKKLDEQEQREEYLESIGDVTKQGNLDGFYRHLYDQKVLFDDKIKEEPQETENTTVKEEISPKDEEKLSENDEKLTDDKNTSKKGAKKRKYRKRDKSESEEEEKKEEDEKKLQHLPFNLDADSDFSIDSSDSENETKPEKSPKNSESNDKLPPVEEKNEPVTNSESKPVEVSNEEVVKIPEVKKPKVDIWKKRTVGEKYEEAVRKFFERKAQREAGTFNRFA